jgi:hypothetical protein
VEGNGRHQTQERIGAIGIVALGPVSLAELANLLVNVELRRAEAADLDFETQLDRLTLIELDDEFTKTADVKEFRL